MKVCICGAGNIAHSLIGELSLNKNIKQIVLLTENPNLCNKEIKVFYNDKFSHIAKIDIITSDKNILKDMDYIIITYPSFIRKEFLLKITSIISEKSIFIISPGIGATNFLLDKYFPKNKYCCLQRVPYISRIIQKGHSVNTNKKNEIFVYYSPKILKNDKKNIAQILDMNLKELRTFWTIVLSNSNPILHTAGLYEVLLQEYPTKTKQFLYSLWNNHTSSLALAMDDELALIMNKLKVNEYKNLKEHYNVLNYAELTKKLKQIESLKKIEIPMICKNNNFYIDPNSRYLLEDLPYGLCLIKLTAQILNIKTKNIDNVIKKLQTLLNMNFITDDLLDVDLFKEYTKINYNEYIENSIKLREYNE